jgi:hypothetical protein
MPVDRSDPRDHSDHEYYEPRHPLDQRLKEHLAKTPWWMISIGAHAAGAMVLFFVMAQLPHSAPQIDVDISVADAPEEPFEPVEPPEAQYDAPIESKDTPVEDPLISDDPPSDHNETPNNTEFHETAGENTDAQSNKPFANESWNTAIGVGPAAAGGRPGRGGRDGLVKKGGGSKKTEDKARRGLQWLARHQAGDGSWSCDAFSKECTKNRCDGAGASGHYTPGTTGLAVLAFLADGNSTRHGQYKGVVRRGLRYLVSIQTPDGCIGPKVADGHYMYNHAIGTMALAEGYGMSQQTPMLKRPAQKSVDFLLSAQNPYLGWRYGVRPGDNDTSVTAWSVLALKSAKTAGLVVPDAAFAGARNWFDKVTEDAWYRTGYTQKGDQGARMPDAQQYQPGQAMTAAAIACRRLMGQSADDMVCKVGIDRVLRQLPKWDPKRGNDYYYWYYGTLATWQQGGSAWKTWSPKLRDVLVKNQRSTGEAKGSWDTQSAWGKAGGRVYTTAINCLSLEIYNRSKRGK